MINLDYVYLSTNLYIHQVRLSRNLYVHYVRLSTSLIHPCDYYIYESAMPVLFTFPFTSWSLAIEKSSQQKTVHIPRKATVRCKNIEHHCIFKGGWQWCTDYMKTNCIYCKYPAWSWWQKSCAGGRGRHLLKMISPLLSFPSPPPTPQFSGRWLPPSGHLSHPETEINHLSGHIDGLVLK